LYFFFFFFSSRRRHTRSKRDWSSDVCSSDLLSISLVGSWVISKPCKAIWRRTFGKWPRTIMHSCLYVQLAPKPPGFMSAAPNGRSEEHTSELQSRFDLVCRLLLEKKKHIV